MFSVSASSSEVNQLGRTSLGMQVSSVINELWRCCQKNVARRECQPLRFTDDARINGWFKISGWVLPLSHTVSIETKCAF